MSAPAFYRATPDGFEPTETVTGPWDPSMSHAGPPAALILDAVAKGAAGMGITRASFEIPRGIPKVPCRVQIEDVRPGRKVRLVRADLRSEAGDTLMSAAVWLIRETEGGLPTSDPYRLRLPPPDECEPFRIDFGFPGYMDGVEIRVASGVPFGAGPSAVWIRPVVPLVEGTTADLYSLCGLFGDLGNGLSAIEPMDRLMAINTDMTLYLSRRPKGEWFAIESLTISHGMGLGMTDALVYDASGFVGKANQSIYFDRL